MSLQEHFDRIFTMVGEARFDRIFTWKNEEIKKGVSTAFLPRKSGAIYTAFCTPMAKYADFCSQEALCT
ncbi:MAG: hypothetical protein VX759_09160 [SAR324 cluster bacterium]|nr:hypothetical protein [SAR324 cluster bacterium]